MRRIGFLLLPLLILLILFAALTFADRAQTAAQLSKAAYYDTFSQPWLNPAKWIPFGPGCAVPFTMECVREIQNGRLRLAVRNIGATDSDSGSQFGESDLYFVNPNTIYSMTADVTLSQFSGIACPANSDQPTRTIVKVTGMFFNTGSGNQSDDIEDSVFFWVDPSNSKTMMVANWTTGSGQGISTLIGYYPIGNPLRVTNAWDKANHQFVSVVQVIGESGPGKRVVVPYSSYYSSDTTLPAYPNRNFTTMVFSQNCTSVQTFAGVEAFFDNVLINVPPPRADQ